MVGQALFVEKISGVFGALMVLFGTHQYLWYMVCLALQFSFRIQQRI